MKRYVEIVQFMTVQNQKGHRQKQKKKTTDAVSPDGGQDVFQT